MIEEDLWEDKQEKEECYTDLEEELLELDAVILPKYSPTVSPFTLLLTNRSYTFAILDEKLVCYIHIHKHIGEKNLSER